MTDLFDLLDDFDDEAGFQTEPESVPEAPSIPRKHKQPAWSKFSEGVPMDPPVLPTSVSAPHLMAVYENVRCTGCGSVGAVTFVGLFVGRHHFFAKSTVDHLEAYQPAKHDSLKLPRDFCFLEGYKEVPVCFGCMPKWRAKGPTP